MYLLWWSFFLLLLLLTTSASSCLQQSHNHDPTTFQSQTESGSGCLSLFAFLHESSPFLPLLDATSETAIAPPTEGGEESEDSHVKTHQELDIYSSCIFYIHMSTLVQKCFSVGTTPYHKFTDQKKCLSSKTRSRDGWEEVSSDWHVLWSGLLPKNSKGFWDLR